MNPKICPTCHRPIPPTAPGGFCPACILRDADEPPPSGRPAPALAEVAAAFPQFEILSLIGQGGMGSVFKVRQPGLDRVVALKILCPELGRDPAFAERFAREARVLAKLNHPNIVTVFEHGECGGFFYLLMEFVDGVNLRQAMRAGRFTPEQALAVVPGICDALQAAHAQGIWHRDIKPENILLDAQGAVKIVDFGIARLVGDPARDFTLTRTGAALGSAPYMAPEQHEKPHEVDHRADIYSLGVVIYEMLTGELPLGRFPAPSQRAAVSARIDEIVFQTLEKEREMRQQSAEEVKTDVRSAGRDRIPVATKATETPSGTRWAVGLILGGGTLLVFGQDSILSVLGLVAVVLGIGFAAGEYPTKAIEVLTGLMWLATLWLVSAAMIGGLSLIAYSDLPPRSGWMLGMGASVFAATTALVYLPLRALRRYYPVFFGRLKPLSWLLAVVAIGAAGVVTKRFDGTGPNANYRETTNGRVDGISEALELMPLLRQAAGDRADAYQLSASGNYFQVLALATQQGHVTALMDRFNLLLPASAHVFWETDDSATARDTKASRAVVWGVASLAAILTALAGGRRAGWLVLAGVTFYGCLILLPVWPMGDSPPLITAPPLAPLSAAQFPETTDFSTPEQAVETLFNAAKRGQANLVRLAMTKALITALEKNHKWQGFMDGNSGAFAKVVNHKIDGARNLASVEVRHDTYQETLYLAQEDNGWKVDGWKVDDPRLAKEQIGPFSLGASKASQPPAEKPTP